MKVPTYERKILDALIEGAKLIHVTTGADSDLDQVVGALKYRVMHYDDDIVNAATTESWTPCKSS